MAASHESRPERSLCSVQKLTAAGLISDAADLYRLGLDALVALDRVGMHADDGETLQVTRIVPLDVALLAGSFSIQDDVTGTVSDTVRFNADFTGTYVGDDGVAETFAWGLGSSGRLVIETAGESDFDSETVTFYLLAGGSAIP